jgi:hypothetical protein
MTDIIQNFKTIADAETGNFDEDIPPIAANLSATVFWVAALCALFLLPVATKSGLRDLGWIQEPWSWPLIVLIVALIGGLIPLIRLLKARGQANFGNDVRFAFSGMKSSLLYGSSFLVYVAGVSWLGFSIASILYMQMLYYLSGLRGWRWRWVALGIALGIILAFRVGLGIWFPLPGIAPYLPDWFSNKLGIFL